MRVVWNQDQWLDAIAAMPIVGPLPERIVLVPSERAAHGLRRAAIERDLPELGIGTRFIRSDALALEILLELGVRAVAGEEDRRPMRVRRLLGAGRRELEHFPLSLVRQAPGWDAALSRAITDLEDAGLTIETLSGETAVLRDLERIWAELEIEATEPWTRGRIFSEAAMRADVVPMPPVLAVATGFEVAAEAAFLRSLVGDRLLLRGARPLRGPFLRRVRKLYGTEAGDAMAASTQPAGTAGELDVLSRFIFAAPSALADSKRPRSDGRDGSVELIEHAGLDDEIESAADWVAEQMLAGVSAGDIAILVPHLDPWAGLLADRLARVAGGIEAISLSVAGGLPLARHSTGARVLAVVHALGSFLRIEKLADLLPLLASDGERISHGAARDLAYRLGTVGGSLTEPHRALDWAARMQSRSQSLGEIVADAQLRKDRGDEVAIERLASLERLKRHLDGLIPATSALCGVMRSILDDEGLGAIAGELSLLIREWVRAPGDGAAVIAIACEILSEMASDPMALAVRGADALTQIGEALEAIRLPTARFGAAAVYVGTLASASGLRFKAVRMLGLAEGRFPASPPDDPVLSNPLRSQLVADGIAMVQRSDRSLRDLHRLVQMLADVEDRVVLSCARLGEERSVREPSAVMLEAAAALDRPRARRAGGLDGLRRHYVEPARSARAQFVETLSPRESAWHERVARGGLAAPERWQTGLALDLSRVDVLSETTEGAMAGFLDLGANSVIPGLSHTRPLSSYRLRKLLECPHRFLFEDLLGYREPTAPPSLRSIDPIHYGGLLHLATERFFEIYGVSFCQRDSDLKTWLELGDRVAEVVFADFCEAYPLVGDAVRAQELERVRRDLREFLEYDWASPSARAYDGVEISFGFPNPVPLPVAGRELFVRGYIDRLDLEAGTLLVRDLKSGRPHPRTGKEEAANFRLDLQLALYGIVAKHLADAWGRPSTIQAAYIYPRSHGDLERAFREDWDALEADGRAWLALIVQLLEGRLFPRTSSRADCSRCPFNTVCSVADVEASAERLEKSSGVLAELLDLMEASR